MSNYTKTTDFASKDTLNPGDPNKIVRGTEFDTEFNNIAIASATKADKDNPSFEGNVSVNGNITVPVNATIDGRDVSVDGTKLDGIEAGADVTDTTNVTAAGAVMDSELTNITAVKTLNQVVNTTSDVNFNTVDGRDVSADGAKLDTVEASADVTDTANVTAAGALMDSELTNITAVKTLNQGVATTDSPTFAGATLGAVTYAATDGTDGQVLMTNGSGVAAFEDMPSSTYLDVTDFGATGDGTTDDTAFIQNAINHASTRGIQTIFFPEGHYKYTTLRFYHDQTDNTAFQGTNLFIGDSTNGTNGTTTFNFGWYIADASDLTVTVEGVEQTLNTHYTVSGVGSDTGGTVTFTAGNVPLVPTTSNVTTLSGSVVDGVATREFYYPEGVPVPNGSNVSVTVGGSATTAYALDIGKRLVVFNVGSEPPVGTNNVVITIQKTINIASNGRDGKFQLRGTGRLAISDLVGLDANRTRLYGSVLESTGDGIIIDTDQEFGTPVDARNFVAKDLTFLADNTGQIIKAEKNPGMSFDTCSFKQFNIAGSGLEVRNCWFFTMNQCYVVGQRYVDTKYAAGGSNNESFTYTFDNPSATSDILVQLNGGKLTETTDYVVTMGSTKTVVLTTAGTAKVNAAIALSGRRTINIQKINTGDGISSQFVGRTFGNFAGLWTITESLIDSFGRGIHWTGGEVTNFSIRDTALQNCSDYNIHADSGVIQQMLLDNVYMENQKVQGINFIKGDGSTTSASIRNLRMTNCFFLGGGTNPRVTGPCIDLDSIDAIDIEGMYVFRPRQTFLNVTRTKNSQNVPGEIKNSIFISDADQNQFVTSTIHLLTGVLPSVHNCVWPGFQDGLYDTTNDFLLFDPTVNENYLRSSTEFTGTTNISKFGFGDTTVRSFQSSDNTAADYWPSGAYELNFGQEYKTYYDFTTLLAGGLAVYLPDDGSNTQKEKSDGRLVVIKNNSASTSSANYPYINVYNRTAPTSGNQLVQLAPGQTGLFIFDGQNSKKFRLVGRTFSDSLDLYDNEKLTFGRGDSTGADIEIYQHSPSETFENNAAGVTDFTYTFDSPVISNRIKVERKPYQGSYSNETNFTVNLSTKTVVLGVATTLNDDIRISTSESRIDTLDGLTLDGLTYPTADGNSGQVLATDGSGTLAFTNASQGGLAHVVDDTTPQLGGNLDLNSNNITGTGNLDFTGTINTALSVNSSGPDVKITGAVPALEFVESDNGGSRMRMAWATSGSFKPTLYQSLYGEDASTYGGINIQTKTSDGLNSHVVYSYDPINDRNWWGTRTAGSVAMQLKSDGTFNVRGGDVVFENSLATSDDFFWDASESRLGLGTTAPSTTLDVTGTVTADGLTVNSGGDQEVYFGNNNDGVAISNTGASSRVEFGNSQGTGGVAYFEYSRSNGSTIFAQGINGSETTRMQLANGGDVSLYNSAGNSQNLFWDASASSLGLGTTSPSSLLHLKSNAPYITFEDDDNNQDWQIQATAWFAIRDQTAGEERMRIDSAGNVGIGVAPSEKLHAQGTGHTYALIQSTTANNSGLRLMNANRQWYTYVDASGDYRIYDGTSATNRVIINRNTGNLGLGTTSPSNGKLTLEGVDGASSAGIYFNNTTATNGKSYSLSSGNSGEFMLYDRTSSAYRLFVNSSGNIGIGTGSPDTLLELKGADPILTIRDSETTVANGNATLRLAESDGGDTLGTHYDVALEGGQLTFGYAEAGGATTERMRITSSGSVEIKGNSGSLSHRFDYNENGGEIQLLDDAGAVATLIDQSGNTTRFLELQNGSNMQIGLGGSNTTGAVTFMSAGNIEAARFDSSGNLLVGQSSVGVGTAGGTMYADGTGKFTVDGSIVSYFNRLTSDGTILSLRKDTTEVGSIGTFSSDLTIGKAGAGLRFEDGTVSIRPHNVSTNAGSDDAVNLGWSDTRFDNIYATNGTIQTSDRNEKQDIEELSDAEQRVAVAAKGLLRKYRWVSRVETKGDDARIHFGIIAQDLQDAFTAEGLDAGRYGMFINSTWTDEETGEERSRMGVRYSELLAFIISAI